MDWQHDEKLYKYLVISIVQIQDNHSASKIQSPTLEINFKKSVAGCAKCINHQMNNNWRHVECEQLTEVRRAIGYLNIFHRSEFH